MKNITSRDPATIEPPAKVEVPIQSFNRDGTGYTTLFCYTMGDVYVATARIKKEDHEEDLARVEGDLGDIMNHVAVLVTR